MVNPVRNDRINRLIEWQRFVLTEGGREEFLQRLGDSGSVREVCLDMDLPESRVMAFLAMQPELKEMATRMMELRSHEMAVEGLEIVDDREGDPDAASRRVRSDYRLKLAEKWNRKDYGKVVEHKHDVRLNLGERLRRAMERAAAARPDRPDRPALEHEVVAEVAEVALPAVNWPAGQKVGEVPGVKDERVRKMGGVLDDMLDGAPRRDGRVL